MSVERYPLSWPDGWKRTPSQARKAAAFKHYGNKLSVADGATRVLAVLELMGIAESNVVISTNIQPTRTGRPRSSQAEPSDPGVAVYWTQRGASAGPGKKNYEHHRVMAIDRYRTVADNLAAMAATLEAMRAIERHGGAEILDRAFTGFTALPAPKGWREILDVPAEVRNLLAVKSYYKKLAQRHHPDNGGSHELMAEINRAWDDAQKELAERISA
jgi:hypothetical protein